MTIDKAEIKQDKFNEKLNELQAYSVLHKKLRFFMKGGKKLIMDLKMEYCCSLRQML